MSTDIHTAKDDLAFLKSVVQAGDQAQLTGGAIFLAAGTLYGLQCLVQWADAAELVSLPQSVLLGLVAAFNLGFIAAMIAIFWRGLGALASGTGARALNGAFIGIGLATLAVALVFAIVAARQENMVIWMLYPVVAAALQGAGWFAAAAIRRRAWIGLVAAGWFAAAIALGLIIPSVHFLIVLAVALFALMALPGWVMIRQTSRPF
ncbi:MAG: hypothetical protein GC199_03080 [Alphaproteobacteria bacterium]|nr:hypothetical protein [Alphaproteobacteria bacterium]